MEAAGSSYHDDASVVSPAEEGGGEPYPFRMGFGCDSSSGGASSFHCSVCCCYYFCFYSVLVLYYETIYCQKSKIHQWRICHLIIQHLPFPVVPLYRNCVVPRPCIPRRVMPLFPFEFEIAHILLTIHTIFYQVKRRWDSFCVD